MTEEAQRPGWRTWGETALWLLVPSVWLPQKYLGAPAAVAYFVVGSAALAFLWRVRRRWFAALAPVFAGRGRALAVLTWVGLLLVYLAVFPLADNRGPNAGSDGDEALDLAARAMVEGRFPYDERTYLDNPITPMPGAVILSIPFVLLLGTSAVQNLFWALAYGAVLRRWLGSWKRVLPLVGLILSASPDALYQVAAGNDYLSNAVYVLCGVALLGGVGPRGEPRRVELVVGALLLGLGLSSRANMVTLAPVLFAWIGHRLGWSRAVVWSGVSGLVAVGVTGAFWAWAPDRFTPFDTSRKLGQFDDLLPHASLVVIALTGLIACLLACYQSESTSRMLRSAAAVLATPVAIGVLLGSIQGGTLDLSFTIFGTFFLFFGVAGCWPRWIEGTALSDAPGPSGR